MWQQQGAAGDVAQKAPAEECLTRWSRSVKVHRCRPKRRRSRIRRRRGNASRWSRRPWSWRARRPPRWNAIAREPPPENASPIRRGGGAGGGKVEGCGRIGLVEVCGGRTRTRRSSRLVLWSPTMSISSLGSGRRVATSRLMPVMSVGWASGGRRGGCATCRSGVLRRGSRSKGSGRRVDSGGSAFEPGWRHRRIRRWPRRV